MTDGLYLRTLDNQTMPEPPVDLTTFTQWIALQPASAHAALLYAISRDLFERREYPGVAFEVRRAADDLTNLSRHTP